MKKWVVRKSAGEDAVVADTADIPIQRHWNNDLHVMLDFYKDNPQKACALQGSQAGGAMGAAPSPYWQAIQGVQESDQFLEGMLLKSLERGALFPFIHYIVYDNPPGPNQHTEKAKPEPLEHAFHVSPYTETSHAILASKGCYQEMFTFVDHQTALLPKRPQNPHAGYIISCFKATHSIKDLDQTWSYWSGADLIVETIPPELRLQRLTFHKKKYNTDVVSFTYVLLCELGEALTYQNKALEFVASLKDRQCGVSSLYSIDHFF